MIQANLTFFKIEKCGFFKRGNDNGESLPIHDLLTIYREWFEARESLAETLPWDEESEEYQFRKKVYCKSISFDSDNGDVLLTLWRSLGDHHGNVYGLRADSSLDDHHIVNANDDVDGQSIIWGQPAYYWFIPSLNIYASIRFHDTVSDKSELERYLKSFITLRSDFREKSMEQRVSTTGYPYTNITFPSEDGRSNLWFNFQSRQYTKLTECADLDAIARDITQFVQRDTISAISPQEETTWWERKMGNLPFISKSVDRESRNIEIIMDAAPTSEELRNVFENYNEEYAYRGNTDWCNLGFRKRSGGGTCWLNQFVVRSILNVDSNIESRNFSSETLLASIRNQRDSLLAPFGNIPLEDDATMNQFPEVEEA